MRRYGRVRVRVCISLDYLTPNPTFTKTLDAIPSKVNHQPSTTMNDG